MLVFNSKFTLLSSIIFNVCTLEIVLNDLSFIWIKGIIKDIEVSNIFNSYYYTIEDKENNEIYSNIWEDNIKLA